MVFEDQISVSMIGCCGFHWIGPLVLFSVSSLVCVVASARVVGGSFLFSCARVVGLCYL